MPKVLEDLLEDYWHSEKRDPQEFRKMDFFRKGKEWLKRKMWSESFWKSESKQFYPFFQLHISFFPLKILNRKAKSIFFDPEYQRKLELWFDYFVLGLAYKVFTKLDVNKFFWEHCSEQRKLVARAFLRKVISLHLNPEMWIDKTFESFKYLNLCEEVGDFVVGRTTAFIDPSFEWKLPFIKIDSRKINSELYFFGYDKKRKKLVLGSYNCEEALKLLKDKEYELFVRIWIRENLKKNSEREGKKCSVISLSKEAEYETEWGGIEVEERYERISFKPPVKLTEEDEKEIINFFIRKYDLPKYKVRLKKDSKTLEFRKSKKEKVLLWFSYEE